MIVGHKKQREFLAKIAKSDNMPHALLFSGPEKIGKKMVAMEFAKTIFCEKKKEGYCGECYSCRNIDANNFPDLHILASADGNIEMEQVRDLEENLSLKPYGNLMKVGIIDDAHLLRKDAQNALLKTLEEPKGDTVLVMITPFPEMLLQTIRSRLQHLKFSLVSRTEIERLLMSLGADAEKAREISMVSSGQIGKSIEFLNDPEKMAFFNDAVSDITKLVRSGYFERFNYAKEINEEPENIVKVLDIWERFFRREMLLKVFGGKGAFHGQSLKKIKEAIDDISKTKYLISSTNTNKKLALENLLIKL